MDRRGFFKVVGGGTLLVAVSPSLIKGYLYAQSGELFKVYEKVQLVDDIGQPILCSKLKKEVPYIFQYPYASTPNFLLRTDTKTLPEVKLKAEDGTEYVWRGGVGKERDLVAYSAICPHQLTHPTPNDSFITYVPKGKKTMAYKEGGVIVCSSHLSAYDPKAGAKVLGGPAPQPLASIVIEVDKKGHIWAVGVLGSDKFHDYFRSFKPELKEFYRNIRNAKKIVKVSAKTVPLKEYTKETIQY
ncbi:hypothetical protein NitYY0826_C0017 [Nitratiruptor sp. YY08-26]|uniref:Rieske 2Fe-2S domain-containing protein n=1 Tax=unclassified Nitratiruptor TaxID=2624044 RepID=UPI00191561E0|nr:MULTISPECIES: Rieske 2Fe-2S domain-containing protein [unclassified Nitratiruptor]BCD61184.1 hypothetical protein NitYY0813_C0017 [Nitratiruptor sp. YY08-13]BCD65117.1 hypothetical protein NitYY0826_C0017 [Nitratiruptor sp. YY08-26]